MAEAAGTERGYRPIEDYAAIGDCHGGALIAQDGDIDWCCLGRFDADPVFCRLLDAGKGGFLSTRLAGTSATSRRYDGESNILRTELTGPSGRVALTDFMPVGRRPEAKLHDYVSLNAPAWLVRRIEVLEGEVDIDVALRPSTEFALLPATLTFTDTFVRVAGGCPIASDLPLRAGSGGIVATARLRAGERRFIVLGEGVEGVTDARIDHLLQVTSAFWNEWIGYCRYSGPHRAVVRRSALVLKLLTYAPSGATAAALTTSLPEIPGGAKNWDYRFCWIRDASLMLFALASLGYSGEANQFYEFLGRAAENGPELLQIGYGIALERKVPERVLDHLEGYRASAPVRTGNAAFDQSQTDLYGYILEGTLIYRDLGGRVSREDKRRCAALIDFLAGCWDKPDQGIWETRGAPRHFVHSKAMCWAAVDRAIKLMGERPAWTRLRDRILASMLDAGRGDDGAFFRRSYGEDGVDGALLLLPMLGLAVAPELLARTAEAVMREHGEGSLVFRHPACEGGRDEGAFLACSFWLVDALLAAGRGEEANRLFDELIGRANDVGLYAEQADAATGAALGNFPQALTHLGLVSSAVNLALFAEGGAGAIAGTYADRARRAVGATFGWRAVLAALRSSPRQFKLVSSRRSVLAADGS